MKFSESKYESSCKVLGSQEMLDRLAQVGINVTIQTLRNWERQRLITPPERGGGYGGKWSNYAESVLAECYAAHMLLQVLPKTKMDRTIPKFSAEMLAHARANCRFLPPGLTFPHIKSTFLMEKIGAKVTIQDEFFERRPVHWASKPDIDLSDDYLKQVKFSGQESFDTMLECVMRLTAELLWFKFLSEGAGKFNLTK